MKSSLRFKPKFRTKLMWVTVACLNLCNCTTQLSSSRSVNDDQKNNGSASAGNTAPAAAVGLPLSPSSAQPSALQNSGPTTTVGATSNVQQTRPQPTTVNSLPDQNSPSSGSPSAAQQNDVTPPSSPTPADQPVLDGDLSRFKYAFFTHGVSTFGCCNDYPWTGVVFTEDANFCLRQAAPMHVSELTMYQIYSSAGSSLDANTVYNVTTWPGIPFSFSPWSQDNLPPGSDAIGWRGTCALAGFPNGGKSFRDASWSLSPQDANSLDAATVVQVKAHLRNNAQEVSWTLDAKRCEAAIDYFQSWAGNHIYPAQIACVRTFVDPLPEPSNPN